jgi:cytochrome c-type biogenesis protein CcmH/NrfG
MKTFFIGIFLVVAIIAGYLYLSGQHKQEVAREEAKREQQIMQKQKQFQDQSRELGQQMQQDLENRMAPVDSANN